MREKLIEAVGSFKFPIESCGCTIGEYIVPYSIQEPLVDHLIANGVVVSKMETTTKWIPVTERLPDSWECVLLYCSDGLYGEGHYRAYENKWYSAKITYEYIPDVTHWMPLPPAPKGE